MYGESKNLKLRNRVCLRNTQMLGRGSTSKMFKIIFKRG